MGVKLLSALAQFFQDDAGAFSCMRLMAFITLLVVLALWVTGICTPSEDGIMRRGINRV